MTMRARKPKPKTVLARQDKYGVPYVAIDTAGKRGFAFACLATWTLRDGRPRAWLMRAAKSIDVPADVVEATRARLAREGGHTHEGNDD